MIVRKAYNMVTMMNIKVLGLVENYSFLRCPDCGKEIPVFGVVAPAAKMAVESTRNGNIGLIATRATIRTGAYSRTIRAMAPEARVHALACPLFVPLVENGRTRPGDVVIETVVSEYLAPLKEAGVDTLVLGCTPSCGR